MTVTIVGSVTKSGSATSAQPGTVTSDSGTLTGDLIVVRWGVRGNAVGQQQVVPPDGTWAMVPGVATSFNTGTIFPMGSNGTSGFVQIFYKVATANGALSSTGWALTTSGTATGNPHIWFTTVYRGASTPTVLGSGTSTTSTTPATAAITDTGQDDILIARMIAGNVASGSTAMTGTALTWDAAVTKVGDQQGAGTSGLIWGSVGREVGPTPHGAVAARTITLTNAPTNAAMVAIGIPASGGGGGVVAPTNTTVPTITTDGSPETGETITSDTGTWANSPTSYAYQWKRNGTNISGASSSSYVLVTADEGQSVTVTVTATNTAGSASATSAAITPSAPPPASPPVNTVAPAITGILQAGTTATCSTGTWTNSPTGYAYQWLRNAVAISAATASTYSLTALDVGTAKLSCSVTATNAGGSVTANAPSVDVAQATGTFAVTRYRVT